MNVAVRLRNALFRALIEIKIAVEITKTLSFMHAWNVLVANILIWRIDKNKHKECTKDRIILERKHTAILDYLDKIKGTFSYEYEEEYKSKCKLEDYNIIWICWLQGIENAPPIIQACCSSVKRAAGKNKVCFVSEKNYRDYVLIPKIIEEKYFSQKISKAHFSDILRCALLAEYGGLWLDATIYITNDYVLNPITLPVWSIKRTTHTSKYIADGKYAVYCLGCNDRGRYIFSELRDLLFGYFTSNKVLIDYFLTDYLICFVQKQLDIAEKDFEQIAYSNPNCEVLSAILSQEFDEEKWLEIKTDTALFKLTWRQDFAECANQKDTFYAKLLQGLL